MLNYRLQHLPNGKKTKFTYWNWLPQISENGWMSRASLNMIVQCSTKSTTLYHYPGQLVIVNLRVYSPAQYSQVLW